MQQNKTVFVTGASGLLGINVIEELLINNYNKLNIKLIVDVNERIVNKYVYHWFTVG